MTVDEQVEQLASEVAKLREAVRDDKVLRDKVSELERVAHGPNAGGGGVWKRSWADGLVEAPPDVIFGLAARYKEDKHPQKVDLVVGAYRTEEGKPYLLPSVAEAERRLAEQRLRKDYAPILGLPKFRHASAALVLGDDSPALNEGRVATCQSLSGTGALSLVGYLYARFVPIQTQVLLSNPTWANHKSIFDYVGFRNFVNYPYWDEAKRKFDYEGMLRSLNEAPQRSIVILHLCAHNPTGCDPTLAQWRGIGRVCWERRHHVVFDSAYQGYASGDLERDAWPARLFERELGLEFAITQSYSKNMGLYGERIGCFSYITKTKSSAEAIQEQVKVIARRTYSNPPVHGALLVTTILKDKELSKQWEKELSGMSNRIMKMRTELQKHLIKKKVPGNWDHIVSQIGMFSFTGMTKAQCKTMVERFHVYMLGNGRISMAGLNTNNVEYVANAMAASIRANPAAQIEDVGTNGDIEEIVPKIDPLRLPSPLGQWTQLTVPVSDPIFGAYEKYKKDSRDEKVNLLLVADGRSIGSKSHLLLSVAQAEENLAEARGLKEYMPIDGAADFRKASASLILGSDSPALQENRVATCQSISGTGALSLVAALLSRFLPIETNVVLARPTWSNHRSIFEFCGFRNFVNHRYWNEQKKRLDIDGMLEDLKNAPTRSIVILQLCAHNPTGCDPSREDWRRIGRICWEKRHNIVLDCAYQGYASGDLERDAWPARLLEREIGLEFAITQSFSKPLGLYSERIGCLSYVCKTERAARAIQSQVKTLVRRTYSNPPLHGARIVTTILNDADLKTLWEKELQAMAYRITRLRGELLAELEQLSTPGDWSHFTDKNEMGMFSHTGLTRKQVEMMRKEHAVYMLKTGRLSWPGLTSKNIMRVAKAIDDVVRNESRL